MTYVFCLLTCQIRCSKDFCILSFSCYDCLLSVANTHLPGIIGIVKLACVFLVLLLDVFRDVEQKLEVETLVVHVLVNIRNFMSFQVMGHKNRSRHSSDKS